MRIISHRGYWKDPAEKNTAVAFERSFRLGFGTETDFRDCGGRLVIAHDPPLADAMPAEAMLAQLARIDPKLPIAINVKADGLQQLLRTAIEAAGVTNFFLFDMSVPDTIQSIRAGLPVYVRQSDVEPEPVLYAQARGVWMDAFHDDAWLTPARISEHVGRGKEVCLVSPELHKRVHGAFWERLKNGGILAHDRVTLCTDLPEEAREFFAHA